MGFHSSVRDLAAIDESVVTLGSFDGLHYGHKQLIYQVQNRAKSLHVPSILITFHPHPKEVLLRDKQVPVELLTTIEEKKQIIQRELQIDHTVILPFTHEFSQVRALDFLQDYIITPVNPSEIIIGYDHSFGRNREGDAAFLQTHETKFQYTTQVVNEIQLPGGETVSSSYIRQLLIQGHTLDAAEYLTRPYQVNGTVEPGEKRGRKIDFPTANIRISNPAKLLPQDGVYLVYVTGDDIASYGMANIGYRPTFQEQVHTVEVHLFKVPDYSLYDHPLTIHFFHRLRQEQEFESVTELQEQLHQDKQRCQTIITNDDPWHNIKRS